MPYLNEKTLVETVNGFNIYFTPEIEYESLQALYPDDTEKQIADTQKSLDNFDSVLFTAKVTAEKSGIELGCDYLGACHYDSYAQFYTEYKNDYYADMRENAINEAHIKLAELCTK